MKNAFMALLALSFLNILSACQMSGQDAPPQNRATVEGPSDGGGGDTCNGKMIESYRVDITGLDEYKEYVQPILNKLVSKDGSKTTTAFAFSPALKNWYIIDCKLQDIPKSRKGLFLESYQTAIHTSREVYIDSVSYASMAKEEKAKLLLHEMVMGYYLMKYLSIEEICKVTGSCNGEFLKISKWKMFRAVPYTPLNSDDHQKIRGVTAWLWAQGDSLSLESFVSILGRHDFDKRFALTSQNDETQETLVDASVLVRMLKKYQWTKAFPKFCDFDPETNVSQSECETTIVSDIRDYDLGPIRIKQIYVKLVIKRARDQKVIEQEFTYPLHTNDQKVKLYTNQFGSLVKATPISFTSHWPGNSLGPVKEGMESELLFLMLNFTDPANPEIYQIKYDKLVWYDFQVETVLHEGVKYRETYGYAATKDDEAMTLFMENELPFSFRMTFPGKVMIKMEPAP